MGGMASKFNDLSQNPMFGAGLGLLATKDASGLLQGMEWANSARTRAEKEARAQKLQQAIQSGMQSAQQSQQSSPFLGGMGPVLAQPGLVQGGPPAGLPGPPASDPLSDMQKAFMQYGTPQQQFAALQAAQGVQEDDKRWSRELKYENERARQDYERQKELARFEQELRGTGPDIGTYNPRDYTTDSFAQFSSTGDPAALQRYEPFKVVDVGGVPTIVDKATGQSVGQVGTAQDVAENVGTIQGAKTSATEGARNLVEAERALPGVEQQTATALDVIDQILGHENREDATGWSALLPTIKPKTKDFEALNDQLKGAVFLEAFKTLKGGGHITEIESENAGKSLARLGLDQSESGYVESVNQLREILVSGLNRARQAAGTQAPVTSVQTSIDDLVNLYGNP